MIRIPFNGEAGAVDSPEETQVTSRSTREQPGRFRELEARVHLLESKLATHAEDLKVAVTDRIERIESRIERAMHSLSSDADPSAEPAANVVEFAGDERVAHHLPAAAALEALDDVNDTLRVTREHLEDLDASVARMRRAVGESD